MSNTFASFLAEDRRLVILRVLTEMPAYRTNSFLLTTLLGKFGHEPSSDQVKDDLTRLQELVLVKVEVVESVHIATLTARGADVAAGRATAPGVKRLVALRMGRKSSVSRLEPAARKHLEKLLREDRLTLDQLLAEMRAKFPTADVSRSGIHRYQQSFEEMVGRMREIEAAAGALVDELGEGVGDKAGALLAQAVTTLATNAALNAHGNEKVSIKEVGELARAARAAMQARTISIFER